MRAGSLIVSLRVRWSRSGALVAAGSIDGGPTVVVGPLCITLRVGMD